MKRYRHDGIGIREQISPSRRHHFREPRRERPPSLVLERVNDLSKGAVVLACASRPREVRRIALTTCAPRADGTSRCEWLTTDVAEGLHEPGDRSPTRITYRSVQRPCELQV